MSAGAFTLGELDVPEPRTGVTPPYVLCAFDSESNALDHLVTDHSVGWAVSLGLVPPHGMAEVAGMDLGHLVGYGFPNADYEQLRLIGDWAVFQTVLQDERGSAEDLELLLAVLRAEPVPAGDPRAEAMADLRGRLLALGGQDWLASFTDEVARMFAGFTREALDDHHG